MSGREHASRNFTAALRFAAPRDYVFARACGRRMSVAAGGLPSSSSRWRRPRSFSGRSDGLSPVVHRTRRVVTGSHPAERSAGGGFMYGRSINVMALGAHRPGEHYTLAPRSGLDWRRFPA